MRIGSYRTIVVLVGLAIGESSRAQDQAPMR